MSILKIEVKIVGKGKESVDRVNEAMSKITRALAELEGVVWSVKVEK